MDNNIENKISFLRLPQILNIIPVSKSTWWAGVKSGRFPQPVKISARATAWRTSDIQTLIEKLDSQSFVSQCFVVKKKANKK